MKVTYSILGLLFIAILWTATQLPEISTDDRSITTLPWIIKTDDKGGSSVFGLAIEQATVRQAQALFNDQAEFGIFLDSNGTQSLEAFFNQTRIAGLQARITLTLTATPLEMASYASQAIDKKGQPSNSYKLVLPSELTEKLLDHSFTSLTYLPKIKLEQGILHARFGKPDQVRTIDEKTQQWLFPNKGLAIMQTEGEKPVFQYVRPDQFDYYFGNKTKSL